jgi:glycosyltransferase involved in cell wall biosynthesis
MGQAGRKRAVSEFGWPAIAAQTADLYAELTHSGLNAFLHPDLTNRV